MFVSKIYICVRKKRLVFMIYIFLAFPVLIMLTVSDDKLQIQKLI